MSNVRIKLVPQEDELWGLTPGGMYCPVCFSKVPANKKVEHIDWHKNLADMFLALGGYKVVYGDE